MSVKNRKGGFFRLYDSLWIPLAAPPKEHTLPVGRVIGARLLRRSPCPRGVASETRGCGGLVPRKAFSFGNLSQSQANRQSWAKPGRTARAGRSQGEPPESWAKPGRSQAKHRRAGRSQAKHRRAGRSRENRQSWAKPGESPESLAKHRRASVTFVQAGGGCP